MVGEKARSAAAEIDEAGTPCTWVAVHSRRDDSARAVDNEFGGGGTGGVYPADMEATVCTCPTGGVVAAGDYDIGDFVLPDSPEVSSFGEPIAIPDIIESTVGLLSSIDVTQHQSQIGDSSEKIVDNILVQNEAAEVEVADKAQDVEHSGEEKSNNKASVLAVESKANSLKSCLTSRIHFPKNKRKRGERKAGSGNWSRQCPSEPDSGY
ncbi:hypothetical protein SASPL_127347 [Salvia splendens]|uniref:Uncharacterized protein n=1 Tax=Salvia splendens TaxID=180675 RepID=A0A8X8XBS5_SALSN|nr:hypothetical protein SASPL_127347 [Salvia splendens]